jgi:hypothetical protein
MKFGVNRPEIDLQKAKHVEHSGEPGHISTRQGPTASLAVLRPIGNQR